MARIKQDISVENGAVYVLRSGTPIYVKTADVSAMIGKSNQWVGQLINQGVLHRVTTPHGSLFDVTSTMREYCDFVASRAEPEKSEKEQKREDAKIAAELTIKASKATVAKLEAEELSGKMHRSEDVAAMTDDLIYAFRGALMALPGRLAVDVAALKTPAEVAEAIRKEVYKVMRELAGYRYDPQKYQERVRERRKWESQGGREPDDE